MRKPLKLQSGNLYLYDTTLRDGAQMQGIQFSAQDKLAIAQRLDEFGMHYIELGWPGANPVDNQVYSMLKRQPLNYSRLVAFGATCKPGVRAKHDPQLEHLLNASTPVITLVAKSSLFHIEKILGISVDENLRMISDSVSFAVSHGREVWIDAEHFFDGFKEHTDVALQCLGSALDAGAQGVVLCDTNGGSLPSEITTAVETVRRTFHCNVGIHAHNDCELAVANALAAVEAGANMVQGTVNGYGERCGNTNLISLVPTLQIKLNRPTVEQSQLAKLTELSRTVASRSNRTPDGFAPYVGQSAFAHKAGLHASAVNKKRQSYEHIEPELVGNQRRILVSQQSGRSNLQQKLATLETSVNDFSTALATVKQQESLGFQYEEGDASLELLLRKQSSDYSAPFVIQELAVHSMSRLDAEKNVLLSSLNTGLHHASVKVLVGDHSLWCAAEGNGPVDATDKALRAALNQFWPELKRSELTDYKVRILNPGAATAATTHVWIETRFDDHVWNTIGCSTNILQASQQALCDAFEFFILKHSQPFFDTDNNRGVSNGDQAA